MDQVEKKSGIAMTMGVIPANNGFFHKWKMSGMLPSATIRAIGGSVTGSTTNNTIGRQDLKEFTMFQPEDWATVKNLGGGDDQAAAERYFASTYPQFLEGMLQSIVKQIIYGNNATFGDTSGFLGLHQYAKNNIQTTPLGGETGSRTTIFVVRWNEKWCSMLINPNVISGGAEIMRMTRPAFNPSTTNTTTGAKQPTWESWLTSEMGFMVASTVSVHAITQIDSTHIPTSAQLMAAMRGVHSDRDLANTKIYCNERGRDYIFGLNDANLISTSMDKTYNNRITTFNGVEIVTDENIRDDETTALD
jgi:hypothetical protein